MSRSFCPLINSPIRFNLTIIPLILTALLFLPFMAYGAINIDGIINDPEWADAQSFRNFVVIDPLTFETPRLPTEARLLSTPEGLAVAFICEQPPEETRTRTITQQDPSRFESDYVTLIVDFDGTGQIAYDFSVSITGSYRDGTVNSDSSSNYDWDGLWKRSVNEEPERWTVEMLLPWSIVAMRKSEGETRRIGVSFQRVLHSRKEKFAFPAAISDLTRMVSDLAKIDVQSYSEQEFDVWPYVTVLSDMVKDSITGKAGLDLFWKPSGRFQVTATLNPDFGQVESDELVINFSATETMMSDKRPFFTENQSFFYIHIPPTNYPVYTRRIGATRDDGRGPSEIDTALKITGSTGSLNYGFIMAHEAEDVGRSFYIGRVTLPAENWSLGVLSTYVDRPFLDRTALVNSLDFDFKPNDAWHLQAQFLSSKIDKATDHRSGYGAWCILEFSPNEQWLQRAMLVRYDDTLDFNDMGYMARNNYVSYYLWNQYRKTDFPPDSRKASVAWVLRSVIDKTTDNLHLPVVSWLQRSEKMRSGADLSSQITLNYQGYDDLISRGNGVVHLNSRWTFNTTYTMQRRGAWRYSVGAQLFQEGYEDWAVGLTSSVTWYPYENLNLDFQLNPRWSRDWLIWMHHDLLASFTKQQVTGQIGAAWFPAESHEVRLRTQWYVINADAKQGYRIGSGGRLIASNDPINSFAMINFALQLRYRYEIAPLSDLYLVYSRGGIDRLDNSDESTLGLLGKSTGIRDSDQILVKLRYRF